MFSISFPRYSPMIPSIRKVIPNRASMAHIREDQPIATDGSRSFRTKTITAPISPAAEKSVPKSVAALKGITVKFRQERNSFSPLRKL